MLYIVINVFIGGPLENQLVEGQPSLKELKMKYEKYEKYEIQGTQSLLKGVRRAFLALTLPWVPEPKIIKRKKYRRKESEALVPRVL